MSSGDAVNPVSRSSGTPTSGRLRIARGTVLGAISLLLAAAAHSTGSGSLPGPGVLLVAGVLVGLIAAVLTARRCRFVVLLVVLAVEQVGLHLLFHLAAAARSCTTGTDPMAHQAVGVVGAVGAGCGAGAMPMTTGASSTMTLAHLVAVVLSAWLLARGEAWLWRAVDRVASAAGFGRPGHVSTRRVAQQVVVGRLAATRTRSWTVAVPRGPPPAAVS